MPSRADPISPDRNFVDLDDGGPRGRPLSCLLFKRAERLTMKLDANISAVITGGASGLGAATARRLAAAGVKVALFDLNAEAGEVLAAQLGGVFQA